MRNDTSEPSTRAVAPPYKNRRPSLLVFGILEILMGAVCCLLVLLMGLNAVQLARMGGSMASLIPGMLLYAVAAGTFITLGIGSILCRRWARSLWLALSASWFLVGIVGTAMACYWVPRIVRGLPGLPQGEVPPHVLMGIMVGLLVFLGLLMLVLPLVLFLFYRSPHVKATCEAEQAQGSWTDALPFPILGAALWTALMCVTMFGMAFTYQGAHPFFGAFALGPAGYALWFAASFAYLASTLGLLLRQHWGWMLGLAWMVLSTVNSTITFLKADIRPMFEAMGMPDMQLQMVERMGMMTPEYMVSVSVAFVIPVAIMLAWAGAVTSPAPGEDRNPA